MTRRSQICCYLSAALVIVSSAYFLLFTVRCADERVDQASTAHRQDGALPKNARTQIQSDRSGDTVEGDAADVDPTDKNPGHLTRVLGFRVTNVHGRPLPMAHALVAGLTSFAEPRTAECRLVISVSSASLSVGCAGYLTKEIALEASEADIEIGDVQLIATEPLRVTVTNEQGDAIAGAEILLQSRGDDAPSFWVPRDGNAGWFTAGTTDNSGVLSVERGASGYSLVAAKSNSRSEVVGVALEETDVTLVIPEVPNLRLRFVDDEERPIPGVRIGLRLSRSAFVERAWLTVSAVSDDDGRVDARLPHGQYGLFFPTLEWSFNNPSAARNRIRVDADITEHTIAVRGTFGVSVRAIDGNTGIELREFEAQVQFEGQRTPFISGDSWRKQATEPYLRVACPWLTPDSDPNGLFLLVDADGYQAASNRLVRSLHDEGVVTVKLERAESLRLRFVDDQGRRLSNLLVHLCHTESGTLGEERQTDREGLVELTGWEEGIWSVQSSFRDHAFFDAARLALPGDGLSHEIRLPRPGWIEGQIIGAEAGEYPRIIAVSVKGARMAASIYGDRYQIADLAPGTYWVTVIDALHGQMAGMSLESAEVGTRVTVEPNRKTVLDFDAETMGAWRLEGAITGLDKRRHWITVLPVLESTQFSLLPEDLAPLATDGSFALDLNSRGASTAMLCVASEHDTGALLLTLSEEISTQERHIVLPWVPGSLRIVPDDDVVYRNYIVRRVDERFTWQEQDVPGTVDLTLAPGKYWIRSDVVVEVTPGQLSRAMFRTR